MIVLSSAARDCVSFWGRGGNLNGFLRLKPTEREYGPIHRSDGDSKGGVLNMVLCSGKSSIAA
jgi:hypothetical protein